MTVQSSEVLYYNGKRHLISNEPLSGYLVTKPEIKFRSVSTACWRGYEARWQIKDRKLYLSGFKSYVENTGEVKLDYLFPGKKTVEATWFTGSINLEATTEEIMHNKSGVKYMQLLIRNGFVVKEVIAEDPTSVLLKHIKLAKTETASPETKLPIKLLPEESINYLNFFLGGFFASNYEVFYIDNSIFYNQSDFLLLKDYQVALPTIDSVTEFIQTINAIHAWEWEPVYETEMYDGIQWSLELELANGRLLKSYGSNAFPGSNSIHMSADFKKLLHAICKLIEEENFFNKII